MGERALKDEGLRLDELEDPGGRYSLQESIGKGVYAEVFVAIDKDSGGKRVAVKVMKLSNEIMEDIEEEYRILRDLSEHPNLPDFYGAYLRRARKTSEVDQIWFVMQLCEGGPVTDLVRSLLDQNKKMSEMHIAFILKETIKALNFLHENHIIHRDIKGSNILLTKEGEIKLVDFGLSRELSSTLGRRQTVIGTPCWMAPEVVMAGTEYDNRADVWALGITAIELGDGKNPFQDMHPTRVLFQITRNPPPTLYRPANWTQNYNDFVAECLVKNPEHRPFMNEVIEHPFLTELPENDFYINNELKSLLETVGAHIRETRKPEFKIKSGLLKKEQNSKPQPMQVEDLAALEPITEDSIYHELEKRHAKKHYYSFIGDILVFLNPNEKLDIYGFQYHSKYKCKSRSDNEPHIYSVADSAYQDMLHHEVPQNIIISGETMSGKTTQFKLLLKHLMFLGGTDNKIGDKIKKAIEIIHAFGNAATPVNGDSTRHILYTQVTYSRTGRTSGAVLWLFQLEKWRVTGNRCPQHANFNIFYYFYDGLAADGQLGEYHLSPDKQYKYLRRDIGDEDKDTKAPTGARETPEENVEQFHRLKKMFEDLGFTEEDISSVWKTLAAILLLGELEFVSQDDKNADLKDTLIVDEIAELLQVDGKKLAWALCNYCIVEKDTAARRRHSRPEAIEAKNVLARVLYTRLVDWLINTLNQKFSLNRAVFGDHHCINLLDMFGFECFPNNGLEQLFVNIFNEQLQYYYNQKVFISEMDELEEEDIPLQRLQFYDNKTTMDELMNKPLGVLHLLDEANKLHRDADFVTDMLKEKEAGAHVLPLQEFEFSVAHYTGKVTYDASLMIHKNRDFLPPELTEVMRLSKDPMIKSIFTNKLSRTGNVTVTVDHTAAPPAQPKKKWGVALMAESTTKTRRYNTSSRGEFSQTKGIRTAAAIFRATSLEILRHLTSGGAHFVRCLVTDLHQTPGGFQSPVVRQQLKALAVVDTARARQTGYPYRVQFDEFLRRYKFLAFDFDETVDETKDNCRLLLVRLKMEGYYMGRSKIFMKYYNEEYLSRLYENQVKKIIKVQSMLRSFLAKRNVATKQKMNTGSEEPAISEDPAETNIEVKVKRDRQEMSQDSAAVVIQKHMKGYTARKKYGPLLQPSGKIDNETADFIRQYFRRWKAKSIFQVILHYRAARHQDLVYFSQQVHLYSQNVVATLSTTQKTPINANNLRKNVDTMKFIGENKMPIRKIPFNIKEFPYSDSSGLCGSFRLTYARRIVREEMQTWDDPFNSLDKGCQTYIGDEGVSYSSLKRRRNQFSNFIQTPYCRDPNHMDKIYVRRQSHEQDYDHQRPVRVVKNRRRPDDMNFKGQYNYGGLPHSNEPKNINEFPRSSTSHYPAKNVDFRKNLKPGGKNFDPILEMEMKAKQASRGNEGADDPPYNFQAMLRKTNYKRDSLRRGYEMDSNYSGGTKFDFTNNNRSELQRDGSTSSRAYNGPVNHGKKKGKAPFNRKDSLESIKMMVATAKDFGRGSLDEGAENGYDDKTELLPGLYLYGRTADL